MSGTRICGLSEQGLVFGMFGEVFCCEGTLRIDLQMLLARVGDGGLDQVRADAAMFDGLRHPGVGQRDAVAADEVVEDGGLAILFALEAAFGCVVGDLYGHVAA